MKKTQVLQLMGGGGNLPFNACLMYQGNEPKGR